MSYVVEHTDKANEQLLALLQYIATESGNMDIAYGYLAKIEQAILRLGEQPQMGSYPRYTALKLQGYRVLIVERHLVFYKIHDEKKTVMIYAIVDGRREYRNLV